MSEQGDLSIALNGMCSDFRRAEIFEKEYRRVKAQRDEYLAGLEEWREIAQDAIHERETLKSQRDELLAAARIASDVLKQERDHTPMTFRFISPSGAIKRLDTAIANAEAPSCD